MSSPTREDCTPSTGAMIAPLGPVRVTCHPGGISQLVKVLWVSEDARNGVAGSRIARVFIFGGISDLLKNCVKRSKFREGIDVVLRRRRQTLGLTDDLCGQAFRLRMIEIESRQAQAFTIRRSMYLFEKRFHGMGIEAGPSHKTNRNKVCFDLLISTVSKERSINAE